MLEVMMSFQLEFWYIIYPWDINHLLNQNGLINSTLPFPIIFLEKNWNHLVINWFNCFTNLPKTEIKFFYNLQKYVLRKGGWTKYEEKERKENKKKGNREKGRN